MRMVVVVVLGLGVSCPVRADDFVDIFGPVWAHKGAYACGSAEDAANLPPGFFSNCLRLPTAMKLKLIDAPEPAAQVYHMRVLDAGEKPKDAWFAREGLTNNPKAQDFIPDPE